MLTVKKTFEQLGRDGKKAFIPYVPFGFPTLEASRRIIRILDECGVDIIELGMPFSDPVADGPIIQAASKKALAQGVTLPILLENVRQLKKKVRTPVALMTYYNPVYQYGIKKFFCDCKRAGVAAVMTVDLPLEEAREYIRYARAYNVDTVFFITPTTDASRARKIVRAARGFIYYVSVSGITGPQSITMKPLLKHLASLRKMSCLPVCVGFGIHTRKQVQAITKACDGVIVGSAIVNYIGQHYRESGFSKKFAAYIKQFYV